MSVVTATILSGGKAMDPTYELIAIDVRREVDRIPSANLTLLDGDAPQRVFPLSDEAFFEPGKEIEIKLRHEGESGGDQTVFKGIVVRHGVEAGAQRSLLNVELKDSAIRLTQGRRSKVFRDQTDDQVIGAIISSAGLKKGAIAKTDPKLPELVQYHCTDWDFILSRADFHGLRVIVEDGAVSARAVATAGAAKHRFEHGLDEVFEFEMEADASWQAPDFTGLNWDLKAQKASKVAKAKAVSLAQGNLDGARLAKTLKFENGELVHMAPMAPKEMQAGVDGRMSRNRLALLRGRISVSGFAPVKLLELMELRGIGKRFNGKTAITGLRHRVDSQGWRTDLQFGISPAPFSLQPDIHESSASGFLPGVRGLQIGVVNKFEEDPDKNLRLRVTLPALGEKADPVWARLASPDAGKERGFFFLPEVGDEVVVGFFNEDPRQPVILGALFSSKNAAPKDFTPVSDKNLKKGIFTKGGTKLQFLDDKKASLLIETAGKNKIVLDDDQQSVQIADQHGNAVTLDKSGIKLKSAKDLIIEAGGKVQIKASGNVDIQGAKVDVK